MALRGKAIPIEFIAPCSPIRRTTLGLLVLRQDHWGEKNGETYLQVWEGAKLDDGDINRQPLEGALDRDGLLALARGALALAGEENLAKLVYSKYSERVQRSDEGWKT